MSRLPGLTIGNIKRPFCIIQGGMGARVSGPKLTKEVFHCGGLGVLSSAGLKDFYTILRGRAYTTYAAVREEIETAMEGGCLVGLNVMRILDESYDETIQAALDAKVSAIFFGAGLPKQIKDSADTAYILIVSSARTLKIILSRWRRRPDAIVVEGRRAGGHLGFRLEDIEGPGFSLEEFLPEVLEIAGDIPVIVAGGIYTHEDIHRFLKMGASGVQMGTRFLATMESGATDDFKQAVVACEKEDIIVVNNSPCGGFPFRILRGSPAYQELLAGTRHPRCRMGYVLGKDKEGKYTVCKAHPRHPARNQHFCICDALRAAVGLAPDTAPMYTVGSNAYRVKKIIPVAELMTELVFG